MATLDWCAKDLAPPTRSAKVRQRFLQPFQHGCFACRRLKGDSCSPSSRPSCCGRARVSDLPALVTVWARIAIEPSMSCSFTGSHEDHDEHCAGQAGSHAVHMDGRLRRPTSGASLGVVESERGLISGRQVYQCTRRRELDTAGCGIFCTGRRRARSLVRESFLLYRQPTPVRYVAHVYVNTLHSTRHCSQ